MMDVLWDTDGSLNANELRDRLADASRAPAGRGTLATTTILTVLSRLEKKGFVTRDRGSRPHLYRSTTTRTDHTAQLMLEVLGSASDRQAALARFIGAVSRQEAESLRHLLGTGSLTRE